MRVITIANSKGGVGKSTITLNLFARLTESGGSCAILDADPQGSIRNINEMREKPLQMVDSIQEGNGLDFLLIDTPPYRVSDSTYLDAADLVLIPCNASPLDVLASKPVIQATGAKGFVLLNRVPPGSTLGDDIRAALISSGANVLTSYLSNRVAFTRSGLVESLNELGDNKASIELHSLVVELLLKLSK